MSALDSGLIQELLSKDDEVLFDALGEALDRRRLGGAPVGNRVDRARAWFRANIILFAQTICSNELVRKLHSSDSLANRVALVAAIADLVASIAAWLPAATVAVLLVREGLDTLCGDFTQKDGVNQ